MIKLRLTCGSKRNKGNGFLTFTFMNYTLQMCLHIVTLQNILSYYNVLNLKITYFVIMSFSTLQAVPLDYNSNLKDQGETPDLPYCEVLVQTNFNRPPPKH